MRDDREGTPSCGFLLVDGHGVAFGWAAQYTEKDGLEAAPTSGIGKVIEQLSLRFVFDEAPRQTVVPIEWRLIHPGLDVDLIIMFRGEFDMNVLAVVPDTA